MKRAIVLLTNQFLHNLLGLPEDVEIVGVVQNSEDVIGDTARIVLKGDGLPDQCKWREGEYPLNVPLGEVAKTKSLD